MLPRTRSRFIVTLTTAAIGLCAVGPAFAANPIPTTGFNLTRSTTSTALLDALDGALPNVSIDTVAGDANRVGPIGAACQSVLPHVTKKFCWNTGDNETTEWVPQGVTSSYDAYGGPGETPGGRSLIVASWYDDGSFPDKGARISVLVRGNAHYRHVLLVVPTGTASSPNFSIANTHAGGLAWYGHLLYVADTDGIRIFDMSRIWRVDDGIDGAIGRLGSAWGAYGYKYVVPQRYFYSRGSGMFRYSSIGLDRTSSPPAMVTTEYRAPSDASSQASPRTVRYNLNTTTRLLIDGGAPPVAVADGAWDIGLNSLQGGVFVSGRLYLSQSDGAPTGGTDSDRGDLYRYTPSGAAPPCVGATICRSAPRI